MGYAARRGGWSCDTMRRARASVHGAGRLIRLMLMLLILLRRHPAPILALGVGASLELALVAPSDEKNRG
jgi:hypothetical protein